MKVVVAVAASLLVVATATACADDPDTASTEPFERGSPTSDNIETESETSALCEAAEDIRNLDDRSQERVNDALSKIMAQSNGPDAKQVFEKEMAGLNRYLDSRLPQIVDAYERLEAELPQDLKADAETTLEFTTKLLAAMANMRTLKDFDRIDQEILKAGGQDATAAVLRLDAFTRKKCDVTLAD